MNDMVAAPQFDRTVEDLGNIVELGHVNVTVPDQSKATAYYLMGLGLTRDPYLMAGLENMWVNVGRGQFHLPTRGAQVCAAPRLWCCRTWRRCCGGCMTRRNSWKAPSSAIAKRATLSKRPVPGATGSAFMRLIRIGSDRCGSACPMSRSTSKRAPICRDRPVL